MPKYSFGQLAGIDGKQLAAVGLLKLPLGGDGLNRQNRFSFADTWQGFI
jgi:hypothetical protein